VDKTNATNDPWHQDTCPTSCYTHPAEGTQVPEIRVFHTHFWPRWLMLLGCMLLSPNHPGQPDCPHLQSRYFLASHPGEGFEENEDGQDPEVEHDTQMLPCSGQNF